VAFAGPERARIISRIGKDTAGTRTDAAAVLRIEKMKARCQRHADRGLTTPCDRPRYRNGRAEKGQNSNPNRLLDSIQLRFERSQVGRLEIAP